MYDISAQIAGDPFFEHKGEIRSVRERLGVALQSMDYMIALATQMELDHLECEARRLAQQNGHEPYPRWDEIG